MCLAPASVDKKQAFGSGKHFYLIVKIVHFCYVRVDSTDT